MKSTLLALLSLLLAGAAPAQPGLSPRTRIFLDRYAAKQAYQGGYIYRTDASGATVMPALLLVKSPTLAMAELESLGVHIGTRAGSVWTASIPPSRLAQVAALHSLSYVELDEPLSPAMDSARRTTRVDSVHAGWGLPKGYSGTGVVMGVLDVGFDYTHPAFWDTGGTQYRVSRVWEQRGTGGTPPAAFGYGRELIGAASIQAAGSDNQTQSHGAHVAGIAAGSGRGAGDTTGRYRGMAFNSEIVLVGITPPASDWMSTGMTDIINGMKYVYDYAASVGKPAVVNLSWGCTIGSHDGRSLFSQAADALTGPGRLFVLSAGNNGDNNLHVQKSFAAADTVVHTFVNFPVTPIGRRSWFDVWGDSAQRLSVRLSLYNGKTRTDSSAWIPLGTLLQRVWLRGAAGDTLEATVSAAVASFNNKPRLLVDLESRTADRLCISVRGTGGTVHAWLGYVHQSTGYYGDLNSGGEAWATGGNTSYVSGDMASTRSGLAVGAFASNNVFVNLAGARQDYSSYVRQGRLVPFSSKGPTTDGRVKPDITGPGFWVTAPVNSFDPGYGASGSSRTNVVREWAQPGGRTYQYAALTGTSMSSPAVAGIAALLLEAAPGLTPDSLRNLLAVTAVKELVYMGVLPNSNWGGGKVNAYAAMQRLMGSLGVSEVVTNPAGLDLLLYPNPGSGTMTLEHRSDRGGTATVMLSDAAGRVLLAEDWILNAGSNSRTISRRDLPAGLYFIRMQTAAGSAVLKAVVR